MARKYHWLYRFVHGGNESRTGGQTVPNSHVYVRMGNEKESVDMQDPDLRTMEALLLKATGKNSHPHLFFKTFEHVYDATSGRQVHDAEMDKHVRVKHRSHPPDDLIASDRRALYAVHMYGFLMDGFVKVPCTSIRCGLTGVICLIPEFGAAAEFVLGCIATSFFCWLVGAPFWLVREHIWYLLKLTSVGLIPLFGDYLETKYKPMLRLVKKIEIFLTIRSLMASDVKIKKNKWRSSALFNFMAKSGINIKTKKGGSLEYDERFRIAFMGENDKYLYRPNSEGSCCCWC